MKKYYSIFSIGFLLSLAVFGLSGCNDDEPTPQAEDPIASFQLAVDATNFLQVSFTNFSQNATVYAWDFGDGNTSTEESPVHTYAEAGSYTVTLTASNASGASATRSESVTITDPDEFLSMLTGATSKVWYLQREGIALGIGPVVGDNSWWSFGGVTPLGDRPCILDDSYTFTRDGSFEFNSNNTIFIDAVANGGWMPSEGCHDESEDGLFNADGTDVSDYANGGSYTFELDGTSNTLTLSGSGAYIGIPTKTENGDIVAPVSTKVYQVTRLATGDIADSLHISLAGDGFGWNFYLVSYHNPADLPAIPSAQPAADFSFTVDGLTATFSNASRNSTSYSWDFGDGATSTEENPSHTYAAEGAYTVTLTASGNGTTATATKEVVISSAEFSAAVFSTETGKIWKLAGEGSYKVGPSPNSGEWWAGLDAAGVTERACQMDDEFIFFNDGAFHYDAKGQVFAEGYMGGSNACMNEGDLVDPFDVFASSTTHTFTITEASGDTPAMITVNGAGAFIGFNKASNAGELPADASGTPATSITYQVVDYTAIDGKETLIVAVDYSENQDGTAWWTMTIESVQ